LTNSDKPSPIEYVRNTAIEGLGLAWGCDPACR
jgi:hypothetical protein